jgi:hypothetical protein
VAAAAQVEAEMGNGAAKDRKKGQDELVQIFCFYCGLLRLLSFFGVIMQRWQRA